MNMILSRTMWEKLAQALAPEERAVFGYDAAAVDWWGVLD